MKGRRHHWLVQFVLDGITAIIIVGGLMFMFWALSTLPMHRYGH